MDSLVALDDGVVILIARMDFESLDTPKRRKDSAICDRTSVRHGIGVHRAERHHGGRFIMRQPRNEESHETLPRLFRPRSILAYCREIMRTLNQRPKRGMSTLWQSKPQQWDKERKVEARTLLFALRQKTISEWTFLVFRRFSMLSFTALKAAARR